MTDQVSLVNLALQSFGSRTTLTAAQLLAGSNNEAKQANLAYENTRDSLLRMAPWNCGMKTASLVYITSISGTPENTSQAQPQWGPGLPRPPWTYEYQYPVDCLKPCWIIPSTQIGMVGTPITTATTGSYPSTYAPGPIVFKVGVDTFFPVTAAAIVAPGNGYSIGDIITLPGTVSGSAPIGAPVQLRVLTVSAGGVLTVEVVSTIIDAATPQGGSYFGRQTGTIASASVVNVYGAPVTPSVNATFTLTQSSTPVQQRVLLANQQSAVMVYVAQVLDPNVWDPLFQDAFYNALGANICMALTGDKTLANMCIQLANHSITEARKADGNEGVTINDIPPDWIRTRGVNWANGMVAGPYGGFDWGGLIPAY